MKLAGIIEKHNPQYPRRSFIGFLFHLMIPVIGLLFLNWNLLNILFLFWMEFLFMGVLTLIAILGSQTKDNFLFSAINNIGPFLFFLFLYGGLSLLVISFTIINLDLEIIDAVDGGPDFKYSLYAMVGGMSLDFIMGFFISGYFRNSTPSVEIMRTMMQSLLIAFFVVFAIAPLADKFQGEHGNLIIGLGLIIARALIEYLFFMPRTGLISITENGQGQ